jgi:hypothetical protein
MEQLHIITLPARKYLLEKEIARMGIDAVYWPAIILPNVTTAISRSHKQIVRFAKENNLGDITIAEDDIIFTALSGWKYFLENKPQDFDLYIGGHYSGNHYPDNTVKDFTGLTLYTISSIFYETFLKANELWNIDTCLWGKGKYVVCNPEVAKQRNGYSFNRHAVVNDDHYLKGRKFLTD